MVVNSDINNSLHCMFTWFAVLCIFRVGLVLMVLGEIGNFSAYGFSPASLVAPLGTTTVIGMLLNFFIHKYNYIILQLSSQNAVRSWHNNFLKTISTTQWNLTKTGLCDVQCLAWVVMLMIVSHSVISKSSVCFYCWIWICK